MRYQFLVDTYETERAIHHQPSDPTRKWADIRYGVT